MSYWSKGKKQSGTTPVLQEKSGGLPKAATVRKMIKGMTPSAAENEFYEMEMGEVISVVLKESELPDLKDGSGKDWSKFGSAVVRMVNSEKDLPLNNIGSVRPLFANSHPYPVRGEYVAVVKFNEQNFYINVLNLFDNVNNNISPGLSGVRPEDIVEEDFIYEHFEPDPEIRNLWPYQGDSILQGRWGNSIRLGSHIIPDSHGDDTEKPDSPNILIRAGQLLDADNFNKSGVVQNLKESPKKPVEEDINADGSSVWMTTDQSVKLNRTKSNSQKHRLMSKVHNDKNPIDGGKQIVINSDRITFNTKRNEIMGYSALGIGWGTPWSFTIDADRQFCVSTPRTRFYTGEYSVLVGPDAMNSVVGGGHPESGEPEPFPLVGPDAVNSNLASACGISIGENVLISSAWPSFLTLDDKAHLQSCKGAILHLDDCAGLKDNQGSFLRIGGEALGITGYVKGRDDMGQQHLVYGEELTNLMDSICNSFVELGDAILNLTAIPTGAGPSGPISGGPPNTIAIEAWIAGVETIRARLCGLLMKPEE